VLCPNIGRLAGYIALTAIAAVTSSFCDDVELQDPERQLDEWKVRGNLSGTQDRTLVVYVERRHHRITSS
jgi:hypothetical protein